MKTLDQDFPPLGSGYLGVGFLSPGMVQPLPGTASANSGLALLRTPFPAHQISTFPKNAGSKAGLSYVGHAALTDRLLDADPLWSWEPMSVDARGLPVLDDDGGMWIRLTVCGVTRLGYGDAQGKTGGNATKERIGDALRNAAMRFGAALELWHKGQLHDDPKVEDVSTEDIEWAESMALGIRVLMAKNDIEGAASLLNSLGIGGVYDPEAKEAAWSRLESTTRSAIKAFDAITHAKDVSALNAAWTAAPKHSHDMLLAFATKRKADLTLNPPQ